MSEHTDFLYPFIDSHEGDASALLTDLAASAVAKARVSAALRETTLHDQREVLGSVAEAMAARFAAGGRLFTFGNGGSSTDAAALAALFSHPPAGRPLPARCLADDTAVITALANDVGFDLVFSRQLIAYAAMGDIALGLSTSGNSRNLLEALDEASDRSMLAIGVAGYDGGEMRVRPGVRCLVVRADSVHRVQETQAALGHALWCAVQERLP